MEGAIEGAIGKGCAGQCSVHSECSFEVVWWTLSVVSDMMRKALCLMSGR